MTKIDIDRWVISMIENFPGFKESGKQPWLHKQALEDQGLEYKDGQIVVKADFDYTNANIPQMDFAEVEGVIPPELKESEDERIRKEIIELTYKVYTYTDFLTCDKQEEMLAWLKSRTLPQKINVENMVGLYRMTPEEDSDFGLPLGIMVRAYRQGILDTLKKLKEK